MRCFSESQKTDIDMTPMNSHDTKTSLFCIDFFGWQFWDRIATFMMWKSQSGNEGNEGNGEACGLQSACEFKEQCIADRSSWKHRLEVCFSSSLCAVAGRINSQKVMFLWVKNSPNLQKSHPFPEIMGVWAIQTELDSNEWQVPPARFHIAHPPPELGPREVNWKISQVWNC